MKLNLKTGVALLLLSAPVFFVAFLYMFGENKFSLSRQYCENDNCYTVPNAVVGVAVDRITIAYVGEEKEENRIALKRLETVIKRDKVAGLQFEEVNDLPAFIFVPIDSADLYQGLKLTADTLLGKKDLVLIDKSKHICGYYSSEDSEEITRLLIELGILLKEDEQ